MSHVQSLFKVIPIVLLLLFLNWWSVLFIIRRRPIISIEFILLLIFIVIVVYSCSNTSPLSSFLFLTILSILQGLSIFISWIWGFRLLLNNRMLVLRLGLNNNRLFYLRLLLLIPNCCWVVIIIRVVWL